MKLGFIITGLLFFVGVHFSVLAQKTESASSVRVIEQLLGKNTSVQELKQSISQHLSEKDDNERLVFLESLYAHPRTNISDSLKIFLGIELAETYSRLGKSDACIDTYFKILPIAENRRDVVSQAIIESGIGTEYFFLRSYDKALPRFQSAYSLNIRYRDSVKVAGSIHNLGTTYSRLGQNDSALFYLHLGLDYFRALKDTSKMAQSLNNLGSFYHRNLEQTQKSLLFFERALEIHIQTGNDYEAGISYVNLGVIYYELGEIDRGFVYLRKALSNARHLNNIPLLRLSLENITEMYEQQQLIDSAFFYQKKLLHLKDTLGAQQQKSIISELEQAYLKKQLEKDKKIAELQVEVLNKWIIISILAISLLLIVSLYFFYKKRTKEELERTKSRFYANIAHEFRTPISLIQSPAIQIMRSTDNLQNRERSKTILHHSDQLLELFNELLDISKLEAGKLPVRETPVEIIEYTQTLLEQFKVVAEAKRVNIVFHSSHSELSLVLDPEIYRKVLHNLISNALKYSPVDTEINVNVSVIDLNNSEHLQVTIKDEGAGISKDVQKQLFKRFESVRSSQNKQGTGLGLALSKELMNRVGGDIRLISTSSEGSVFAFNHPIKKRPVEDATQTADRRDLQEAPLILIVDDHKGVRDYLMSELNQEYQILTAENGEEGYKLARKHIPDIIISDLVMPRMDGLTMAQEINTNELTEHIPVLLLTARHSKEFRNQSLSSGAISYMTKPFDIEELKHQLNSFLRWQSQLKVKYSSVQKSDADDSQTGILEHSSSFVQKIIQVIENHLDDESFSIERLAEQLALSRTQVHRKVKGITGLSTSALVRAIRLEKAEKLLLDDPELTVSEIAYSCGFSNPSYFSKSYSEYFGKKPSDR